MFQHDGLLERGGVEHSPQVFLDLWMILELLTVRTDADKLGTQKLDGAAWRTRHLQDHDVMALVSQFMKLKVNPGRKEACQPALQVLVAFLGRGR